ncbi:MAG: nucleoside phosphorylase [Oscillospiraceae bacterium]|nr:nucleoside phosphorylase [Oscillospiraceae bacterium]
MSIIHAFDNASEEILRPCDIAKPVEGFPKTVIAVFQPKMIEILKTICPVEEISSMQAVVRIPVYRFSYRDCCLGLYTTMIGGPAAVGLLEEMIVKGTEKVLVFGAAGVLDRSIAAGHLIIPTAACRDEGTSYHYLPESDYIEVPTAAHLGQIFAELKIPYVTGKIWTTDAIYRETRSAAAKRREEGCIAVDMECASLMAAGAFRNIPVYQFVYGEDSLDAAEWDPRSWGCVPASDYEKYLRIALETAIRL